MKLSSLQASNAFILWKREPDASGQLRKVPYALDGYRVGTDEADRHRLVSFQAATNAAVNYNGIGFVFVRFNNRLYVCGIDIDHQKPDSGFVKAIIARFPDAYIELSPSGEGVHIVLLVDITRIPQITENGKSKLHKQYYSKNPGNGVECYVAGLTNRYFTYTGATIQDGRDADQTDAFLQFLDLYMLRNPKTSGGNTKPGAVSVNIQNEGIPPLEISDGQLLDKARAAKSGDKFRALYDSGDITGYASQSNADLALMNLLAFWTRRDRGQMERLFSQSALGQRGKWRDRADYRNMTLGRAIQDCTTVYEPPAKTTAAVDITLKPGDFSDVGQAEILAREYGDNLRYSEATDFISYNGVYWEECKPKAQGLAQELTRRQLEEARAMVSIAKQELERLGIAETAAKGKKAAEKELSGNAEHWDAYIKLLGALAYQDYVIKERESKKINAALKEVQPMVLIDVSKLDADPYLLNTPSATYDLRRGMDGARPHNPGDFITQVTAVDPSDQGEGIWQDFLYAVYVCNEGLIDFAQLKAGESAIGKIFNEQIGISTGDGRNGKSTFWNPIFRAFGTYSGSISADALTASCRHNVRPELAELRGKRIVLARELQEGKRLDESILKKITSTDPIDAEKKYKSPFTFTPTHSLQMFTNFLPKIGSRDRGTTRRLCVIPFTAKFEGTSDKKNYGDYLFEHAGGAILKWIIEGAKKVIDMNFHIEPPECVKQATQEYIDAFDWLSSFLQARCEVSEGEKEQSGALYTAYREHCDDINETYKRSAQDFNAALIGAGFERVQQGGGKKPAFFTGLRLLSYAERVSDVQPL